MLKLKNTAKLWSAERGCWSSFGLTRVYMATFFRSASHLFKGFLLFSSVRPFSVFREFAKTPDDVKANSKFRTVSVWVQFPPLPPRAASGCCLSGHHDKSAWETLPVALMIQADFANARQMLRKFIFWEYVSALLTGRVGNLLIDCAIFPSIPFLSKFLCSNWSVIFNYLKTLYLQALGPPHLESERLLETELLDSANDFRISAHSLLAHTLC